MKSYIGSIAIMAALMSQSNDLVHEKPDNEQKRKVKPNVKDFTEDKGLIQHINEYKLIKQGKSKKSLLKQNRIIEKVHNWIQAGLIKESDLIKH